MCEMLGNYHFVRSQFSAAAQEYEAVLSRDTSNLLVRQRLIVCYIGQAQFDNALSLFLTLLESSPAGIMRPVKLSGDCPCQTLLLQMEQDYLPGSRNADCCIAMGILLALHDPQRSVPFFKQAVLDHAKRNTLNRILCLLSQQRSSGRTRTNLNKSSTLSNN